MRQQTETPMRRIRRERGISQVELARRLNLPQPRISEYETGRVKRMSFAIAVRIANALGVDPRELFDVAS